MRLCAGVGKYVKRRFFDESRAASEVLRTLVHSTIAKLAAHPNTTVYVSSGLDVESFDRTDIAELDDVGLCAENGKARRFSVCVDLQLVWYACMYVCVYIFMYVCMYASCMVSV